MKTQKQKTLEQDPNDRLSSASNKNDKTKQMKEKNV